MNSEGTQEDLVPGSDRPGTPTVRSPLLVPTVRPPEESTESGRLGAVRRELDDVSQSKKNESDLSGRPMFNCFFTLEFFQVNRSANGTNVLVSASLRLVATQNTVFVLRQAILCHFEDWYIIFHLSV